MYEPEFIDFGKVKAGEKVTRTVRLINGTQSEIMIERTESSCDCLWLDTPITEVPAGQSVTRQLVLDLKKEPAKTGRLRMMLTIYGKSGLKNELIVEAAVAAP